MKRGTSASAALHLQSTHPGDINSRDTAVPKMLSIDVCDMTSRHSQYSGSCLRACYVLCSRVYT
jgi:hypothetical protein